MTVKNQIKHDDLTHTQIRVLNASSNKLRTPTEVADDLTEEDRSMGMAPDWYPNMARVSLDALVRRGLMNKKKDRPLYQRNRKGDRVILAWRDEMTNEESVRHVIKYINAKDWQTVNHVIMAMLRGGDNLASSSRKVALSAVELRLKSAAIQKWAIMEDRDAGNPTHTMVRYYRRTREGMIQARRK